MRPFSYIIPVDSGTTFSLVRLTIFYSFLASTQYLALIFQVIPHYHPRHHHPPTISNPTVLFFIGHLHCIQLSPVPYPHHLHQFPRNLPSTLQQLGFVIRSFRVFTNYSTPPAVVSRTCPKTSRPATFRSCHPLPQLAWSLAVLGTHSLLPFPSTTIPTLIIAGLHYHHRITSFHLTPLSSHFSPSPFSTSILPIIL